MDLGGEFAVPISNIYDSPFSRKTILNGFVMDERLSFDVLFSRSLGLVFASAARLCLDLQAVAASGGVSLCGASLWFPLGLVEASPFGAFGGVMLCSFQFLEGNGFSGVSGCKGRLQVSMRGISCSSTSGETGRPFRS